MAKYRYGFDHYGEYEDIAPCKFCGCRPYANLSGISCRSCGYGVSRAGRKSEEIVAEWNADPEDGAPRARPVCDVRVDEGGEPTPSDDVSPREVVGSRSLMYSTWSLAGGDMSSSRARAVATAMRYADRWIPKRVERNGEWDPVRCPTCGEELSSHVGDGTYDERDWLEYCPNDECHQKLDWER